MAIRKIIPAISSKVNWKNQISGIRGVFLTSKNYTLTDAKLASKDFMLEDFQNDEIIPLHFVQETIKKDEETQYNTSIHDFTYKTSPGKYRQTLRFNWDLEFFQFIQQYSGTDLNIIFYFNDNTILLYDNGDGTYRGLKTNRIILEKINAFHNYNESTLADLDVELKDINEVVGSRGTVKRVDWMLEVIDILFIGLNVLYIDNTQLNFSATYHGVNIEDIETNATITITDDVNGNIDSFIINYSDGQYSLTGLSENISYGTLQVEGAKYYGCTNYRYIATTTTTYGFALLDDDGFVLLDDDVYNLLEI